MAARPQARLLDADPDIGRYLSPEWLPAESWGRVTPGGTILPLALTHETLGALVGARRPTVTLALGEVADVSAHEAHDEIIATVERLRARVRAGRAVRARRAPSSG